MRRSRVVLSHGKRDEVIVTIICEATRQVLPVYGLNRISASALAHLLLQLRNQDFSLPEYIEDEL